jgi:hypothetical protein
MFLRCESFAFAAPLRRRENHPISAKQKKSVCIRPLRIIRVQKKL